MPVTAPFNWTCPHCQRPQVVTNSNYFNRIVPIANPPGQYGPVVAELVSITCQNADCRKMTLSLGLSERVDNQNGHFETANVIQQWLLIPESAAKPQPDYIPKAIVEDYSEACRIKDLSPKASATLARRCLQGMIRDFCGISKARLIDEIKELRTQIDENRAPRGVTHESVDAIDAVREVGNIGAHMEKDVDLIVEIDDNEAQALIDLIETLFEDWYVARETRKRRFAGH
jgi:hypothetical protein